MRKRLRFFGRDLFIDEAGNAYASQDAADPIFPTNSERRVISEETEGGHLPVPETFVQEIEHLGTIEP